MLTAPCCTAIIQQCTTSQAGDALLFDKICGQQTARTSIWSSTRSPSNRLVSHGCIIYGALAHGVCVCKHMYRRKVDTLSNYCDSIYIYSAL